MERDPLLTEHADVLDPGPAQVKLVLLDLGDLVGEEGVERQAEEGEANGNCEGADDVRVS